MDVTARSESPVYVRNATGLVRELSGFDAFNIVFSAVLIPVGIIQVLSFAPFFFQGANVALSFLIATPLVACFGLVYLFFTVTMPRSGGDYVWVSRTLSPMWGFLVNSAITFVHLTWVSFNFTFMMSVILPNFVYLLGGSYTPDLTSEFAIATVLTIAYTALMAFGVRVVSRFMAAFFVIVWIGIGAWLLLMLAANQSDVLARFDALSGGRAAQIVADAAKNGYSPGEGIAWGATVMAMVYCFQVYTGFQWTGYFAGEVKNIRRSAVVSIMGALAVSAVVYTAGVLLVYRAYGYQFFGSLVYMGFNATSHYHLAFSPYLVALIKFLPGPTVLLDFIGLCFLLSIVWWTPAGFMIATRNMFAWSFDRLAPEKLAEVSDRWHSPLVSVIVAGVLIELLNLANIYLGLGALLLNIIAVMAAAFIITSIAAVVFPYRRPQLFESAPSFVRARFAGIPVMSVVGVVSALGWGFVLFVAFTTTAFGAINPVSMAEAFAVPAVMLVYYLVVRQMRRSQGLNLDATFHSIPPE
jgi:amino acid transporter